jgi:TatD DNase family protein
MPRWIDTHCHLDAAEFSADRLALVARARAAGVELMVLPAVDLASCAAVRGLAQAHGFVHTLGIHPLYVMGSDELALQGLHDLLSAWHTDARCVAVGEIGLDDFAPPPGQITNKGKPSTHHPDYWQRQIQFFTAQLKLACEFDLPVVVHVRRCVDEVLKQLRRARVRGGIVHAFNGSEQQAKALIDLGFKLGFGGAMTFERALQVRRLAKNLPLKAIVLETDAPDMPPHWLYRTAQERDQGLMGRNEPGELPRMAQILADLRGMDLASLAWAMHQNTIEVLPKLQAFEP